MNLLVFGWYGHHNTGDESYKVTIPLAFPGHNFRFIDNITSDHISWCDCVIVGGGNVLKEFFLKQLSGVQKPIYGLSVGLECKKDLTPDIPFKHIWGRDNYTVEILNQLGVSASFLPDLGFIENGDAKNGRKLMEDKFREEGLDLYERVITVVLNSHLTRSWEFDLARDKVGFEYFSYKMANIADDTMASFLFLPFGTDASSDDRIVNAWTASKCKYWKKNYIEHGRPSIKETLDLIAASDLVISTRLHSSIFAYACGVPFIDITHHSKNKNFLETFGKGKCSFSYWDFSPVDIKNAINQNLTLTKCIDDAEAKRGLIHKELNAVRFIG